MTTDSARGRRRTPTRIERAAGKAAVLQKPRIILALLLLLGADQRDAAGRLSCAPRSVATSACAPGPASSKVPDKVLDGGPILTFRGGQATRSRCRTRPSSSPSTTAPTRPGRRRSSRSLRRTTSRHVLPGRLDGLALPGARPAHRRAGQRDGHAHLHPCRPARTRARPRQPGDGQTQLALAGAAGITTTLFRAAVLLAAPTPSTTGSWPVYQKLGEDGYTSVFIDTDSDDWKRPGVSKIVKWATPEGTAGRVGPLHDAGGDRSQTIAALPPVHREDEGEGLHLHHHQRRHRAARSRPPASARATVPLRAAGRSTAGGRPRHRSAGARACSGAGRPDRRRRRGLRALLALAGRAGSSSVRRVLGRFGMMLVSPGATTGSATGAGSAGGRGHRPVSVIVPAYNEKECIANTLKSLAASTHPIEIIVVDDGSTDNTAEIAEALGLPQRPGHPPGERGQAGRPQQRCAARQSRHRRDDGRRHRLRARHRTAARAALRRPGGRRGRGQRQGRQPGHDASAPGSTSST